MTNTLLWTAGYIDAEGKLQTHKNIEIKDGVITAISDYAEGAPLPEAEETICCKDYIVTPGFVNMHAHAAMNIFKGIAEDASADAWFNEYIYIFACPQTKLNTSRYRHCPCVVTKFAI